MANRLLVIFSFILSLDNRVRYGSIGALLGLMMGMAVPGMGPAAAQSTTQSGIRGDRTLGNPSQSTSVGPRTLIQGGVSQGSNLFHSFQEFNVNEGQQVYFANPDGIENILSRVTGSDRTNILGTLGVDGPANLFLLNPNGILFGPNAQLDMQGSFLASTADRLTFENGSFFSATQPQNSLLSISTPVGLQYGNSAISPIDNLVNATSLSVAFAGNQVTIVDGSMSPAMAADTGEITLFETGIENASGEAGFAIAATDNITLQNLSDNTLNFQSGVGAIHFTADADGSGTGAFIMEDATDTIQTFGRDIAIAGASLQLGSINTAANPTADAGQSLSTARTVGQPSGPALTTISGQLSTATDVDLYEIYISGTDSFSATTVASQIANPPNTQLFLFDATGRGLYANDNDPDCNCRQSTLSAASLPAGSLPSGTYYLGIASYATEPTTTAGTIFRNSLEALEFNALKTPTGPGQLAPLNSWVSEPAIELGGYDITLTGVTGIANQITEMPLADSGDISLTATHGNIQTGELTAAATNNGGAITLTAQSLDIAGTLNTLGVQGNGGRVSLQSGGDILFRPGASVLTRGQLGGDLLIRSDHDIVVQGGLLLQQSTTTDLTLPGGGFDIAGRSLRLQEGAQIISETLGTAPLKDSQVNVQEEVVLGGFGALNLFNPFGLLATQVGSAATGEGGALTLNVGTLRVNDAAVVATRSFGLGNAGDFSIFGDEVVVSGAVQVNNPLLIALGESIFESELSTEAESEEGELLFQGGIINSTPFLLSEANAGDLLINVGRLRVENGGEVSAGTHSVGNGGNFTLIADEVIVTGQMLGESSELGTETEPEFLGARPPEGDAGNLVIVSDLISVTDGGKIGAETLALGGDAGSIQITARAIEVGGGFVYNGEVNTSAISSEVKNAAAEGLQGDTSRDFGGQGGSVVINAERLLLRDGGRISASTDGNGDAGSVTVNVPDIGITGAFIPTVTLAADAIGNDAGGTPIASGVFASSNTAGQSAGNIDITANNQLRISDRATIEATTLGEQGNITLTGGTVLMSNGSQITTNAGGSSTGGNITLDLDFLVAGPFFGNNNITANAEDGSGGQIQIRTRSPILGFQVTEADTFRTANLTPADTATNDITAFSQFNPTLDTGSVTIEPPELDPTEGIVELPVVLDASDRIATGCAAQQGNRFAATGQGGLPADPRQGLRRPALAHDFRLQPDNELVNDVVQRRPSAEAHSQLNGLEATQRTSPIVEAQTVGRSADGTLILMAATATPYSSTHIATTCQR